MDELTDRERILTNIVRQLHSTILMKCHPSDLKPRGENGIEYAHFSCMEPPKSGDLVLAQTGPASRWSIGWYVEPLAYGGGAVIREIGSGDLCNYSNESFMPLTGMDGSALYEGGQRKMYLKILSAFRKGDEYLYRFGGVEFFGDEVSICIREWHGGFGRASHPFKVRMKFGKRTTVKAILKAMRLGGYGSADFSFERPEFIAP